MKAKKRNGRKMPKNVLAYFKALRRVGPVDEKKRAAIRRHYGV